MPQAFTGHLLVQDAFALMHQEEAFVTMHDDVSVALDRRSSRLEEEAGLARGNPDGAKSGEDGGPHLPECQTLRTERGIRLLLLLLDPFEAGDQRAKSSCKPLLRLRQVFRGVEVRH